MYPTSRLVLRRLIIRPRAHFPAVRQLGSTPARPATDKQAKDQAKGMNSTRDDHVSETKDANNAQIDAARAGKDARQSGSGKDDDAVSERDVRGSAKKGEKENPEAPKPVIGLNDERGTVGGHS